MEEIKVRIIPGCPSRVIAETEADRELAEVTLANLECGCVVELEGAGEAARAEVEEAAEAAEAPSELSEEEVEELAEVVVAKAKEGLVCPIEPEKPWEESVCGVVAEEAGRQAADRVMARLREEGLVA